MSETEDLEWFRRRLHRWSEGKLRSFPWRAPDATFYEVFIAEMFLRRTRADVVAGVLPQFLDRYPNMAALQAADPEVVAEVIRPLGLQNRRTRALMKIADTVDGVLPRSTEELAALPGAGPYVAAATMCFATDVAVPIIDRNVERVYGRFLGTRWGATDDDGRLNLAGAALNDELPRRHNLALLDFAAAVCTARDPDCMRCPMAERCAEVDT
jgi:A/G-specific adenine glycosylase